MGPAALIALAALAGGLVAVAIREAILSAPRAVEWLRGSVKPLRRIASEGHVPSAEEQRRLGLLGSASIAALTVLITGPGPWAVAAAAGPWCVAAIGCAVDTHRSDRGRRYNARLECCSPSWFERTVANNHAR